MQRKTTCGALSALEVTRRRCAMQLWTIVEPAKILYLEGRACQKPTVINELSNSLDINCRMYCTDCNIHLHSFKNKFKGLNMQILKDKVFNLDKKILSRTWGEYNNLLCRGVSTKVRSFYDDLNVTPNATHGQIKTAYYNLSKTYHPDRNKGSEAAAKKFREITAAYEVLGNHQLRKMYDKGILTDTTGVVHETKNPVQETVSHTGFQSQKPRSKYTPTTGRTSAYNFDEWQRAHYGAAFNREQENKRMSKIYRQKKLEERNAYKGEVVLYGLIMLLGFSVLAYLTDPDADKPVKPRSESTPQE